MTHKCNKVHLVPTVLSVYLLVCLSELFLFCFALLLVLQDCLQEMEGGSMNHAGARTLAEDFHMISFDPPNL